MMLHWGLASQTRSGSSAYAFGLAPTGSIWISDVRSGNTVPQPLLAHGLFVFFFFVFFLLLFFPLHIECKLSGL